MDRSDCRTVGCADWASLAFLFTGLLMENSMEIEQGGEGGSHTRRI